MLVTARILLILVAISQNLHVCDSSTKNASDNANDTGTSSPNIPTFTLSNGIAVPLIGLGSASGVSYPHIAMAIDVGYRYVDTAQSHSWGYREEDVADAILNAKLRYQDADMTKNAPDDYVYVVQTKIHPQDLGYRSTQKAIELSLTRLKVSSLDSILLHKPRCWEGVCSCKPEGTWHDSWTALEEAIDAGMVRSIGICDVDNRLLDELLQKRIGPTVIQNWFDPFHQDKKLRRRIERHNEQHPERKILYQGYSTLGTQWRHHKGYETNPVMNHPTLKAIAEQHGVGVPQVVIQWATRREVMVLPASRNVSHQISNLNSYSFELSQADMRKIDGLDGKPPPLPKGRRNPDEVQLKFVNRAADGHVNVYWVPENDGQEEVHVGEMKHLGDELRLNSYHGHRFLFKDAGNVGASGKMLNHHHVDRSFGPNQNHDIDDNSEEL